MNPYHYTQFHFLTLSSETPKYQLIGGEGSGHTEWVFPYHGGALCEERDEI